MDIDSPPSLEESLPLNDVHQGHRHLVELPPLSASFPLPFRVLALVGLAIFLWATNLHILHSLNIDPARVLGLDFRDSPTASKSEADVGEVIDLDLDEKEEGDRCRPHLVVYKLGIFYSAWVLGGWVLFRGLTGGDLDRMESWRGLVGAVLFGAALGGLLPYRGVGEWERRALRRSASPYMVSHEILTCCAELCGGSFFLHSVHQSSSATSSSPISSRRSPKSWAICGSLRAKYGQAVSRKVAWRRAGGRGTSPWEWSGTSARSVQNWTPRLTLLSLPYTLRFRQCIMEYHQSSYTSPRPLANALKYFSAFPVILLSAMQKTVVADLALAQGITVQELKESHSRWFGEHRLFRLWLLAVMVNSMFSFYWDVEMDWGLKLCEVDTWFPKVKGRDQDGSGGRLGTGLLQRCLRRGSGTMAHQRSPCPSPSPFPAHSHAHSRGLSTSSLPTSPVSSSWLSFGLRHVLLLPDPIVYHIFTLLDFILRLTWSLKLSSHLHTIAEIESGVFMMEALELLRRWMWVFVRVEWEAVKQAEVRSFTQNNLRADRGLGIGQVIWAGEGESKDGV